MAEIRNPTKSNLALTKRNLSSGRTHKTPMMLRKRMMVTDRFKKSLRKVDLEVWPLWALGRLLVSLRCSRRALLRLPSIRMTPLSRCLTARKRLIG